MSVTCPVCGEHAVTVYVHGHEQCAECGRVAESCCDCESAQPDGRREPTCCVEE